MLLLTVDEKVHQNAGSRNPWKLQWITCSSRINGKEELIPQQFPEQKLLPLCIVLTVTQAGDMLILFYFFLKKKLGFNQNILQIRFKIQPMQGKAGTAEGRVIC